MFETFAAVFLRCLVRTFAATCKDAVRFRHVSSVPRASACLILACLITFFFRPAAFHTHTQRPGAGLARGREMRSFRHVSSISACFGMFDFGMFKYFLMSACCIPHTHTLPARCWSCSWSRGRAQLRCSNVVQRRHDRCCFLHANFHHVVLVVLFWSLWPN